MPNPTVKKRAEEYGVSVSKIESVWEEAKKIAEKEGKKENWAYIESIFESMVKNKFKKKSSSLVFRL